MSMAETKVSPGKRLAGIYCRASSDPKERGLSVETQEEDGRAWCALNGFEVAWVVTDNDFSASLWAAKKRPGYADVQRRLAGGDRVDVLVARDSSRLQRDMECYVMVRALCAQYGVLWAYNGRIYDLERTDDRFTTGLDALMAERRASETRDDVIKSVNKRVRTGKPHGRVAYGYKPVYDLHTGAPTSRDVDPDTAPVVQLIVSQVLAEASIYSICKQLDAAGVPSPEAVRRWRRGIEGPSLPWNHRLIRDIALNPTYAGYRTHKGEIKGEGQWPALISAANHQQAKDLLLDPNRRTWGGIDPTARYLLSGIAKCGKCGSRCERISNRGRLSYACAGSRTTWRGSRCVTRAMLPLDAYVADRLLLRLESPDAAGMFDAPDDTTPGDTAREIEQLEARLEGFRASAERPDGIPVETLARMEATYGAKITAARARMVGVPQVVRDILNEPDARAWWSAEATPMSTKRAVIRALMEVTIHPSNQPHGTKGFDSSSIQIRWFHGEDA